MDFLKKWSKSFFKDKNNKKLYSLALLFCLGVALLVISKTVLSTVPDDKPETAHAMVPAVAAESGSGYELELTERLENILSLVDGAGNVKVMLTVEHNGEREIAVDKSGEESSTEEKDINGASRDISESKLDEKTVLAKQSDGSEAPVVLKETNPRIEGVIIVSEGGDNIFVKDALIKAVCALLGIEPHKVSVLKMK